MALQILVLCTANICRSPLAEALFASEVARRGLTGQVMVQSAGIQARWGDAASPMSTTIADRLGLDLSTHRSTPLASDLLTNSDLILTMTSSHQRTVVALHPDISSRCFTLRGLTRLTAGVAIPARRPCDLAQRLAELTVVAAARWDGSSACGDDIADPYGASEADYEHMARQLLATIPSLAARLFGPADQLPGGSPP